MNVRKIAGTYAYFVRKDRKRSLLMLVAMLAAGLLEGIGFLSLLPVLSFSMDTDAGTQQGLTAVFRAALESVGLEISLSLLLMIVASAMILKSVMSLLAFWQIDVTVAKTTSNLREDLMSALLSANWLYYVNETSGKFTTAISNESLRASQAFKAISLIIVLIIQVAIYTLVALLISPYVTLLALVVGAALALLLKGLVRATRAAGVQLTQSMNLLVSRLTDILLNFKSIKAMGQEEYVTRFLHRENEELTTAMRKHAFTMDALTNLQEPILVIIMCAGIYGATQIVHTPFSEVMVFALLFYRIVTRVSSIQVATQNLAGSESAFDFVSKIIRQASDHPDVEAGGKTADLKRDLSFDRVSLDYGRGPVLENVDFTLPATGLFSIVGPSGAGKTTLIDLIVGLIRPTSGAIHVDGVPLADIDQRAWRRSIGYLPQEAVLFNDTIRANLTLSSISVDDDVLWNVLDMAHAKEFVEKLPLGLDTVVGEGGKTLSGGQRQRIALARALVNDPALLILDESTSGLDSDSEKMIVKAITEIAKEKPVISVSHTTAFLRYSAMILKVGERRVVPVDDPAAVTTIPKRRPNAPARRKGPIGLHKD